MPSQKLIELFDKQVVVPALAVLGAVDLRMNSLSARELLVGTAVAESDLVHGLQVPGGPARSRFQIEPGTVRLLYDWLRKNDRSDLEAALWRLLLHPALDRVAAGAETLSDHLAFNDWYGCGLARTLYWSWPDRLPEPGDWRGHAEAWKRMYNTAAGKGTPKAFLARNAETIRYFEQLRRAA